MKDWVSYFWSGAIAIILSFAISGALTSCYFGNREVNQTSSNPDTISGLYNTQPQTLQFCATVNGTTNCKSASPTSQVPAEVSQEMTNPVAVLMQDLSTGLAVFSDPTNTGSLPTLPVTVNSNQSLAYNEQTSPAQVWNDPSCTSTESLQENGSLSGGPGSGRVAVTIQIVTTFDGTCGPTLQSIYNCYQDSTQCGGTSTSTNQQTQSQWQTMFNPYIQTAAMTATDIPNVANIAYEVTYQ